jgi:hypothetical protein
VHLSKVAPSRAPPRQRCHRLDGTARLLNGVHRETCLSSGALAIHRTGNVSDM